MQRQGELKPRDAFRDMEFALLGQRAHGWPMGVFGGWRSMWQKKCQELDGTLIMMGLGCRKEFDCFPHLVTKGMEERECKDSQEISRR